MFVEGQVKSYNAERGFGFIAMGGKSKDLFFHIKDLPERQIQPQVGERFKFMITEDAGKLKADRIQRLDVQVSDSTSIATSALTQTPIDTPRVRHIPQSRALANATTQRHSAQRSAQSKPGFPLLKWMLIILIFGVTIALLKPILSGIFHRAELQAQPVAELQRLAQKPKPVESLPQFKCDGRIHCSQMHSYEEAVFFMKNCPGTKMDGDGDGQPCESQYGR